MGGSCSFGVVEETVFCSLRLYAGWLNFSWFLIPNGMRAIKERKRGGRKERERERGKKKERKERMGVFKRWRMREDKGMR